MTCAVTKFAQLMRIQAAIRMSVPALSSFRQVRPGSVEPIMRDLNSSNLQRKRQKFFRCRRFVFRRCMASSFATIPFLQSASSQSMRRRSDRNYRSDFAIRPAMIGAGDRRLKAERERQLLAGSPSPLPPRHASPTSGDTSQFRPFRVLPGRLANHSFRARFSFSCSPIGGNGNIRPALGWRNAFIICSKIRFASTSSVCLRNLLKKIQIAFLISHYKMLC